MNTTVVHADRPAAALARTVLGIFKLRIGMLIMITALAGLAVTPGRMPSLLQVVVLALSVLVASASAGAFNQYIEADTDRLMVRTRRRAFASGALKHTPLWLVVIGALLAGAVAATWFALNATAALFIFLGAFFYAVVYTVWLKRRTWLNIVIGGLAGSFAALAGSAAVDPALPAAAWVFAAALFFWTPPHFWSLAFYNKRDYERAGIPMLPNLLADRLTAMVILAHTMVLVALTLLPPLLATGWLYGLCAAIGGALFLKASITFVRLPTRANGLANFHASLWQLGLLLAGAIGSGIVADWFVS